MDVDRDFVLRVAKNARLSLTERELDAFVPQFKELLDDFSKLSEVDTTDVEPSIQPVPLRNVLREDTPEESVPVEDILSNTKHRKDNYFLGPKAI